MKLIRSLSNSLQHIRYQLKASSAKVAHELTSSILYQRPPSARRLCIFAAYSFHANIDEYVYYYLSQLSQLGFDIVFCSASSISAFDQQRLQTDCRIILEKPNVGLDFTSWKCGLNSISQLDHYEALLLANDSVFGPLFNLEKNINAMQEFDSWGFTDSYSVKWHLQSYFLYFKPNIFCSEAWSHFWNNVSAYDNKYKIVYEYEIGLSQYLLQQGFKLGCCYDSNQLIEAQYASDYYYRNMTLVAWHHLVEHGFPFIKRELFKAAQYEKYQVNSWSHVLKTYPKNLIENFLISDRMQNNFIAPPNHRESLTKIYDH